MKYIKKYESFEKYSLSDNYKDKFFLPPVLYKKGDFYIVLVDEILLKNSGTKPNKPFWPKGDCFTYVNNKFMDPAGYGLSYTKEEFEEIDFM
jgi:hypothetical protein